jgi:hypothetical protein
MTTDKPVHGLWGRLRMKETHTGRKPTTTTKTGKRNPKPAKRPPGKMIAFLEMPQSLYESYYT